MTRLFAMDLLIVVMLVVMSGCTNAQRGTLVDYVNRDQCAQKYMRQKGTGIQNAYLQGLHECRYADIDARKAKERAKERDLRPETSGEQMRRELARSAELF